MTSQPNSNNDKESGNEKLDGVQRITLRIPEALLVAFENVRDKSVSRNDSFITLLKNAVKERNGVPVVNPEASFKALDNQRLELINRQLVLQRAIDKAERKTKYPAIKHLHDFAIQIGHTDCHLEKNLPEAIQLLIERGYSEEFYLIILATLTSLSYFKSSSNLERSTINAISISLRRAKINLTNSLFFFLS